MDQKLRNGLVRCSGLAFSSDCQSGLQSSESLAAGVGGGVGGKGRFTSTG